MTNELMRGYWPSYNVAYFDDVYEQSGTNIIDKKANKTFKSEYDLVSRAKIFRRDNYKVQDTESLKSILRYNQYQTDPFAEK